MDEGTARVTLARYETAWAACDARARLAEAGIDAAVLNEAFGTWFAYLGAASGQVQLAVAPRDADVALAVLAGELPGSGSWVVLSEGQDLSTAGGGGLVPEPTFEREDDWRDRQRSRLSGAPTAALARRAQVATWIGLFISPILLSTLALVLATRALRGPGRLSPGARWQLAQVFAMALAWLTTLVLSGGWIWCYCLIRGLDYDPVFPQGF